MAVEYLQTVTNQEGIMNIKSLLLGVSVAGFAGSLPAHDLWLTSAPSGTQLVATIFFGETNRRDLPIVQRLAYVDVIDGQGHGIAAKRHIHGAKGEQQPADGAI